MNTAMQREASALELRTAVLLVANHREDIQRAWSDYLRSHPKEGDLVVVLQGDEKRVMIAPRAAVWERLRKDRFHYAVPQLAKPANEVAPKMPVNHAVWVVVLTSHARACLRMVVSSNLEL